MKKNQVRLLLIIISYMSLVIWSEAEPSVSMKIEPKTIPLNGEARLSIVIENGGQGGQPELPAMKHLMFSASGQSSRTSIINGEVTSSVELSYRVTADKEGEYEIPAVTVQIGGKRYSSDKQKLKVTAAKKGAVQSNAFDQSGLSDAEKKKTAFIKIQRSERKGREHLYVGESRPVSIKVYLRDDLNVMGLNKLSLTNDAFTLSSLSEDPEQNREVLDGVRYRVITWYGNISGVKAGEYAIKAKIKATIGVPVNSAGGMGMKDPFFDQFFRRYEHKELSIESEDEAIEVVAPPMAGRPDTYSGAVGQFKIKAKPLPSSLELGDAVTHEVYVEGKGNFDRVRVPVLMPEDGWKRYKVSTELERGDALTYHARKHFKMPTVIQRPGEMETYFRFSYFDPDLEEYKTIESQKSVVHVKGSMLGGAVEPKVAGGDGEVVAGAGLVLPVIREDVGGVYSSLIFLYERIWYWVVGLLVLFTIIGSFVILQRRKLGLEQSDSSVRRAQDKREKQELKALEQLMDDGGEGDFLQRCCMVLRMRIASKIGCNMNTVTIKEVEENFPHCDHVIEIFKRVEEIEYGSHVSGEEGLEIWLDKTKLGLDEIEGSLAGEGFSELAWGQVARSVASN